MSSATEGSSVSCERAVNRHSAHRSRRIVYPLTLPREGINSTRATRFAAFPGVQAGTMGHRTALFARYGALS